jgi:RimJ/RimL family protein N-acetyltransferase
MVIFSGKWLISGMVNIPTIETERLRLRDHRKGDLEDCVAMWSDPIVVRYTIGKPSTRQQTWARLLTYLGHWSQLGFGYWAVEEKASGRFVGEVGFADFKRELTPSIEGTPELGWVLAPAVHGKGYATEALRAALAWGDLSLKSRRSVCLIDPGNAVSLRVAEKIGFSRVQETAYNGAPVILFERARR